VRRQAIDLALDKLRVLESLDAELNSFGKQAAQDAGPDKVGPQEEQVGPVDELSQKTAKVQAAPTLPERRRKWPVCNLLVDLGGRSRALPAQCAADSWRLPPYMLNLFGQLEADLRAASSSGGSGGRLNGSAGQQAGGLASGEPPWSPELMPYEAQTMRSFRQPTVKRHLGK